MLITLNFLLPIKVAQHSFCSLYINFFFIHFFQVFRAMANILELTNYSMTFYIYCLFSEDFRNTLLRTVKWPWFGHKKLIGKRNNDVSIFTMLYL